MCSRMQCSRAAATERKHMAPAMSAVQRPWWVRKNRAFWTKTFIISALYRGFATGVLAGELPSLGSEPNRQLCACFLKKFVEGRSEGAGEGKTRLRCWKEGFQPCCPA